MNSHINVALFALFALLARIAIGFIAGIPVGMRTALKAVRKPPSTVTAVLCWVCAVLTFVGAVGTSINSTLFLLESQPATANVIAVHENKDFLRETSPAFPFIALKMVAAMSTRALRPTRGAESSPSEMWFHYVTCRSRPISRASTTFELLAFAYSSRRCLRRYRGHWRCSSLDLQTAEKLFPWSRR